MELDDLLGLLKTLPSINGNQNFGVYYPNDASVKMVPKDDWRLQGAQGIVYPNAAPKTALIQNEDQSGYWNHLDTMFHELAHTQQKGSVMDSIGLGAFGPNQRLRGTKFEDYDATNSYPHPDEILATMRAHEAMQRAGKTIWDTDMGKDYLQSFLTANPDMDEAGAKRYIDTRMFPEHSVMHSDEGFSHKIPFLKLFSHK